MRSLNRTNQQFISDAETVEEHSILGDILQRAAFKDFRIRTQTVDELGLCQFTRMTAEYLNESFYWFVIGSSFYF